MAGGVRAEVVVQRACPSQSPWERLPDESKCRSMTWMAAHLPRWQASGRWCSIC